MGQRASTQNCDVTSVHKNVWAPFFLSMSFVQPLSQPAGWRDGRRAQPAGGRGGRRAQAELLAVPEAARRALLRQEVEAVTRRYRCREGHSWDIFI